MRGGIDDVGVGVLFGLYDHRFEAIAMKMHADHLDSEYGAGPHTISVPRLRWVLLLPAALPALGRHRVPVLCRQMLL